MKRIFFTLSLLMLLIATATAQYFPVDTARLNGAYRTLVSGNRTVETEMEFLRAFPSTWLEFYMTYGYVDDENYDPSMAQQCSEHISTLFSLSSVNDTLFCKKIVNLAVGMKEVGECTSLFQDYLVAYILNNDQLMLEYISKLKKGYRMEFWQFCWSSVTECCRADDFKKLYNRNKKSFPEEMKISRIAFHYFYEGINYPTLFPAKKEAYSRKYDGGSYEYLYNDYLKGNEY